MRLALAALVGCSVQAPRPLQSPLGNAPWGGPSEVACDRNADGATDRQVDGYTFCGEPAGLGMIPVDDPVRVGCDALPADQGPVYAVFDGVHARAFPVELMRGRELVNDDWYGEPLLVDY